jgi:plastocyanin
MIRSLLATTAVVLGLVAVPASATPAPAAAAQTLTWTADNDINRYKSAPTTAAPGETTIVFENSEATGNTTGMTHTLTFDTSTTGYNHDVNLNIIASPLDSNGGRHEATVTLTPGKYRYFCAIPGHGQMFGEFTVTEGGGGDDTTPPTVTVDITGSQNGDGDYVGAATVAVAAEDTQSDIESVEYQIDDTGFQEYTAPVQVIAVGDHTVQYRATDTAGNTSEVGSEAFTVVEGEPDDTTPPTVTADVAGEQNDDGAYVGRAEVRLTATDEESGVESIEYQPHDGEWTEYTAPVAFTTPGEHVLHHRATDGAGNTSDMGMVSLTVVAAPPDTTPPTVSAEVTGQRDEDGAYEGTATVTVAAEDAGSGVDTVEIAVDGGEWTAYSEPVVVSAVGEHTVRFRATDEAGNASDEGSVAFTVVEAADRTPPTVAALVTGDQNARWEFVGGAKVTLTAEDDESEVESVEYALGAEWLAYGEPVVVTAPGRYTLRWRATDAAGNTSEEASGVFTVVARTAKSTGDVWSPRWASAAS